MANRQLAGDGRQPHSDDGHQPDGMSADEEPAPDRALRLSRRALLGGAAGAAGVAALSGAGTITTGLFAPSGVGAAEPKPPPNGTRSGPFRTRPGLVPPEMQVTAISVDVKDGYILATPTIAPGARTNKAAPRGFGQQGAMLLDAMGNVVWFLPIAGTDVVADLQVQTYRGQPVLTYWVGKVNAGAGYGEGIVLDTSYRQVAKVKAGNGLKMDLHDLVLTPEGTALIPAYFTTETDLTSVGGPKKGKVLDNVVQEVDLATGKVLFEWHSIDHVPVAETYKKYAPGAFDYFHLNSIFPEPDSNRLLISARNTWTVYAIDRATGAVVSRLGGKKSDFAMGPGTNFEWQHCARRQDDGTVSIFDNGAGPPAIGSESRAIFLTVDEAAKTASLKRVYTHPAHLLAYTQGSSQVMPNGHIFVGWGDEPYYSELDQAGNLVLDGRFPTNIQSYRVFRSPWVGKPADTPVVVTEKDAVHGVAVYVSWNGATEVVNWVVRAGKSADTLRAIAAVPKAGFETAVTVHPKGNFLAVAGVDASGNVLGVSKTVKL